MLRKQNKKQKIDFLDVAACVSNMMVNYQFEMYSLIRLMRCVSANQPLETFANEGTMVQ